MVMRCLSILFFMGALAGCGGAADPQPKPEEEIRSEPQPVMGPERTIIAFGNSLFAGYGVGKENSYPSQLEAALRAQGINAKMVNAGVSGDTTAAGLQRLAFTLDAQETKPELLLLELGGNDLLRGLSPDQTRANFVAMLDELKSREIPVLLMGMRAPPNYGPEFQAEFDALYGDLAEDYDVALVPFWMETIYQRPELFQNDRIHPTTEGLSELVVATKDAVVEALPELPEDASTSEAASAE